MEKRSELCEVKFLQDSLFGLQFACALDMHFQQFLAERMGSSIIEQFDSSYCDLSNISRSVEYLQFLCHLPASLSTRVLVVTLTKSQTSSATKKGDSDRFERNEHANKNWIIASTVKLSDLFTQDSMKQYLYSATLASYAYVGGQKATALKVAKIRIVMHPGLKPKHQHMINGKRKADAHKDQRNLSMGCPYYLQL